MKNICKLTFPLMFACVLISGCASKSYVVLLENPDGSTGQVIVTGDKGQQIISKAHQGAPLDGATPPAPVDEQKIRDDFGAAMSARPPLPIHFLLYFVSGGTQLTPKSTDMLANIIEIANKRPAVDMSVIGHTDTLGDAAVNEALALDRARSIAELLKSKGLKVKALSIESHGERNLLVKTPDDTSEPRNRRVEISIR